jgi:hypothetical protein
MIGLILCDLISISEREAAVPPCTDIEPVPHRQQSYVQALIPIKLCCKSYWMHRCISRTWFGVAGGNAVVLNNSSCKDRNYGLGYL